MLTAHESLASIATRLTQTLMVAAVLCGVAGCTYSGANRQEGKAYQPSTADPYTNEFQQRIPPGGD